MHTGPRRRTANYEVQVEAHGEWRAVTTPVSNRNTALTLAERLNSVRDGYEYRAFNRYTRRETRR